MVDSKIIIITPTLKIVGRIHWNIQLLIKDNESLKNYLK